MIDGPHRSLSLPRHWKAFARRAEKEAFSASEITECFHDTMIKDGKKEIPLPFLKKVTRILDSDQNVMFKDQAIEQLMLLRKESSGCLMRISLLDYLIFSLSTKVIKDNRLHDVVCNVITDHSMRRIRQFKEHYILDSGQSCANRVIERTKSCISEANINEIAKNILDPDFKMKRTRKKRTSIDDGVEL